MEEKIDFIWLSPTFVIEPISEEGWLMTEKIKFGGMQEIGRCVGCHSPVIAIRIKADSSKGLIAFSVIRCRSNGCKERHAIAGNEIDTYGDLLLSTVTHNKIQQTLIRKCQEATSLQMEGSWGFN